jgi:hypothetical protein
MVTAALFGDFNLHFDERPESMIGLLVRWNGNSGMTVVRVDQAAEEHGGDPRQDRVKYWMDKLHLDVTCEPDILYALVGVSCDEFKEYRLLYCIPPTNNRQVHLLVMRVVFRYWSFLFARGMSSCSVRRNAGPLAVISHLMSVSSRFRDEVGFLRRRWWMLGEPWIEMLAYMRRFAKHFLTRPTEEDLLIHYFRFVKIGCDNGCTTCLANHPSTIVPVAE